MMKKFYAMMKTLNVYLEHFMYYSGTQNIMVSDRLLWWSMNCYSDDQLNYRDDQLNYGYVINFIPMEKSF